MAKDFTTDPATLLRVTPGFALDTVDPDSTPGYKGDKADAEKLLVAGGTELRDLQERLWAQSRFGGARSLLLVLQAMDSAGKGGIVQHVTGAISPEGLRVFAFKKPTPDELAHDFLWRIRRELPTAGLVGVFDRSHYEDVLIGRVRNLAEPAVIVQRYGQINDFEKELADAGTTVVKVMLQISPDEQKSRLADRLASIEKQWKYNPGDIDEREKWPDYQAAYQLVFDTTSSDAAPWYVVPGNHKWYARIAVQRLLIDALRGMDLTWPVVDYDIEVEKKRLAESL